MIKVVVLYGHPSDSDAFEKYYSTTHMALLAKVNGFIKAEITKFLPNEDGSKPEYYRMAELWFDSAESMQKVLGSAEGQATTGDLKNFATGGAKIIVGMVG